VVLGEFGPCGIVGGMQFNGRSGLRCLAIARHGRRLVGLTDTHSVVSFSLCGFVPLPWDDAPGKFAPFIGGTRGHVWGVIRGAVMGTLPRALDL